MNPISFPNLNLTFNINPIAFQIGNVSIYWYGLLIAFAMGLSLYICKRSDKLFGISFDDAVDFATIAIIVGIVCARLYYVIFKWDYYSQNPIKIIQINQRRISNLWRDYRRNCCSMALLQEASYYLS